MRKAGILLFLQCQNGRKLRITNRSYEKEIRPEFDPGGIFLLYNIDQIAEYLKK